MSNIMQLLGRIRKSVTWLSLDEMMAIHDSLYIARNTSHTYDVLLMKVLETTFYTLLFSPLLGFVFTKVDKASKDIILRSLEIQMEQLQPDFETSLAKRQWLQKPPDRFKHSKSAYDKIYKLNPNGFVF